MNYSISHPTKNVICNIDLPASKSISNRLLIIKALCEDKFLIKNLSDCEDTKQLIQALKHKKEIIDVGAAGTSFRFLTSYLAIQEGKKYILTGSERMKERPIKFLVDALREIGAEIEYLEEEGFPPIKIKGKKIIGGNIKIDASVSSQFISSILLIAPKLKNGITLKHSKKIVSKSYINMTLKLMSEYGISYNWKNEIINIPHQKYRAKDFLVESDWSSASFWYEIAALSNNCKIQLNGLIKDSIQKDRLIQKIFKKLGVRSKFIDNTLIINKSTYHSKKEHINLIENPDLYQPLQCTLFGLKEEWKITGTQTLKDKESNRIDATKKELLKIINGRNQINTHQDHRIAMSFAPLCLKFGTLKINDVMVVKKSYPNFWQDLKKGGFKIKPLAH